MVEELREEYLKDENYEYPDLVCTAGWSWVDSTYGICGVHNDDDDEEEGISRSQGLLSEHN